MDSVEKTLFGKQAILDMLNRGRSTAYRLENWAPETYENLRFSMQALGLEGELPAWIDEAKDPMYHQMVAARLAALTYDDDEQRGDRPMMKGMRRALSNAIDRLSEFVR